MGLFSRRRPDSFTSTFGVIRAEYFGTERLEQHALSLAAAQTATQTFPGHSISGRLLENENALRGAHRSIVQAADRGEALPPAAEWLLDNFHVVDEQLREIKEDLPPGFYRRLPKLTDGHLAGYPRVFGIAWALVAHSDSEIDALRLTRFVDAYQSVTKLTIGELWAVAITLRVLLVENVRRVADEVVARLQSSHRADEVADRIAAEDDASGDSNAFELLGGMPWSIPFAVQLAQRYRDNDPRRMPPLRWLLDRLAKEGTSIDQIIQNDVFQQTAFNVSIRNAITSMRLVSTIDWRDWFEGVSPVDEVLRAHSAFAEMDFGTRDMYRRAIEQLADWSRKPEFEVAKTAVAGLQRDDQDSRAADPGYFLIAEGRPDLERRLSAAVPAHERFSRWMEGLALPAYLISVGAWTLWFLAAAALISATAGGGYEAAFVALALLPASDLALALINRFVAQWRGPRVVPGLALEDGVPPTLRTVVVVPTMMRSAAGIARHVADLEVHHLANPDRNVAFALLTDWRDADAETLPEDDPLLRDATARIATLNAKYAGADEVQRFYLFHRRRTFNRADGIWMGWERKRGKLHEFNRFLLGHDDTTYIATAANDELRAQNIRFVVTLDADTRLPLGSVRSLVGKMAHPLSKARFDAARQRVVLGHGVLQPRVTPSLPFDGGSLFQRIHAGPGGIDPYAFAASDVYQDLFDEGSYTGKGIYDLRLFEAALQSRIPENSVLSHDLIEGVFARAGLCSDVEVMEEAPASYDVAAARQHRWVRGDWQLLPWIFGRGAGLPLSAAAMRLPAVGRWKLIDNLRRSLSPAAALLLLLTGWLLPGVDPLSWTAAALILIAAPHAVDLAFSLWPRRRGIAVGSHARKLSRDIKQMALRIGVHLTFLPHQAFVNLDAIVRAVTRVFVTRRKMLEWQPYEDLSASAGGRAVLRGQLIRSFLFGAVAAAAMAALNPPALAYAAPALLVWVASPLVARALSRVHHSRATKRIGPETARELRSIARRTWAYFEVFVTAADNHLPPDNFQEDPSPVLAHRTSPTNIGLYLLCCLAARDFGWIATPELVARVDGTLRSLQRLERLNGHFLNWYDTATLASLEPRYVSTVDSGNLAGHLIALANGLEEAIVSQPDGSQIRDGLADLYSLLQEAVQEEIADTALRARLTPSLATLAALARPGGAGPDLAQMSDAALTACEILSPFAGDAARPAGAAHWAGALRDRIDAVRNASPDTPALADDLRRLADECRALAYGMDFAFLLDPKRELFSIGYRVGDASLDRNYYDLLASEARLASFFAIAKGDVPAEHWFRLGRTLAPILSSPCLISWSGSMFEYLMPSLVMAEPARSLLETTNAVVVRRQQSYGRELNVPWGMSESQYNARDLHHNYQYTGFGVPDLGYKRGLSESIVIAPYATGLAAIVDPHGAVANYRRLTAAGARGSYGWFEAMDYTRERLPAGQSVAIMKSYMAHHQAMTILGIATGLEPTRMRGRFHREASIRSAELLLQERMPVDTAEARPPGEHTSHSIRLEALQGYSERRYTNPHTRAPRTHLMSNGRYAVMMTAAGSGYSRWNDIAITRWREDGTLDNWGHYFFLRDSSSGKVWSAGYQPIAREPESYEVVFSENTGRIERRDAVFATSVEVTVSPEDDGEVRRVSITNRGTGPRELDVTSYCELVLARQADDNAHPAFSKLFVQTEYVAEQGALLATRRRRSDKEPEVWVAHVAVVHGQSLGDIQYETDRYRFLGRGNSIRTAEGMQAGRLLSNTTGPVLDAIFSLRRRVRIARGETAHVDFWTVAGESREQVLRLVEKLREPSSHNRAVTQMWTHAQMQLHHMGIRSSEANLFQRLASHLIYSTPSLRPAPDVIRSGARSASTLWACGISGDLPIVLALVDNDEDLKLVRQLMQAHAYWRTKRLDADIVILNKRASSYLQDFQFALESTRHSQQLAPEAGGLGNRGDVFFLRADLIPAGVEAALLAAARVVLSGSAGELLDQVNKARDERAPRTARLPFAVSEPEEVLRGPEETLEFFNGLGGFGADGREYVVTLEGEAQTPAPWVNVVANAQFGFQVSAEGAGNTWAVNSQQNQITSWSNDPVENRPSEAIYIRDEETGDVWTPTASPIRLRGARYRARHGQGYTVFEHQSHGIKAELTQFVAPDEPVKIFRLRLQNTSGRVRALSVTAYVEWALAASRGMSLHHVQTEIDPRTMAIFAVNPWSNDFAGQVAFLDMAGRQMQWTGDRVEFVGRNGSLSSPAGLARDQRLSNRTGPAMDPCGAMQTRLRLGLVESTELVIFLGSASSREAARALVLSSRAADLDSVFAGATKVWSDIADGVTVRTPDRALDLMLNRWLPYQVLSARIWGRAGFYQASGAYGFRDQLQDSMSLCISRPDIAREQLLRAASRQFIEGDVQHWWLPESGRGIRTRITDDPLWLALVAATYVRTTGDEAVLREQVPFLEAPLLRPDQHDSFDQPAVSPHSATLLEHCVLGIQRSLATGAHGLPLMGTGDWNDGMDRVGADGKGESIWLAWLLLTVIDEFAPLAKRHGCGEAVAAWRTQADVLKSSVEEHGWDGDWYRRAYFDDGSPLGSALNSQCRIDSIAQSWSVISGGGSKERQQRAMMAVDHHLIRRDERLSLLFAPAFEAPWPDPGYIRGYPQGIRENGGQYTHAAVWAAMAFAKLGDGDRCAELLSMLNPISHSSNRADAYRYRVEPYVICADIYGVAPHVGRGGWTWYTGSAGWAYRAALESLLGIRKDGEFLIIDPCIPRAWPGFEVAFRHKATTYRIVVENPLGVSSGVVSARVDGEKMPARPVRVPLTATGAVQLVEIVLG